MAKHRKPPRRKQVILAALLGLGAALVVYTLFRLFNAPEDSAPVWVCSVQGNRTCGPECPPVSVYWGQFLRPSTWL